MSLRFEKSETTFCVKTLFKRPLPFFKRTKDGLRLTKKTSTSFGWERELFSDIFFKNRKIFYLFFTKSSESLNIRGTKQAREEVLGFEG